MTNILNIAKHSGVGVSIKGIERIQNCITKLKNNHRYTTSVFKVIGRKMRQIQMQHFEDEKQFDGSAWPPLSDATLKRSGRGGSESEPLRDSGRMKNSITSVANQTSAVVGTNIKDSKSGYGYPEVHQFGTRDGRVPKREFIYLTPADSLELMNLLVYVTTERTIRNS